MEYIPSIICIFVLAFGFVVFWGAPYVPTRRKDLSRAFDELYKVGKNDVLVDIGSGDGVILRAAADKGAKAIGYELNPLLVAICWWVSRRHKTVSARVANFWKITLPDDTTLVYIFAVSRDSERFARKMQHEATRLGRPLLLISYGCKMPIGKLKKTVGAHMLYEFMPLQSDKA